MPATAAMLEKTKSSTPSTTLLTPHLVCRDADGAIDFYKRAFGAEEIRVIRSPEGGVIHAALTIDSAMFFLANECIEFRNKSPQSLGGSPVTLHLHVKDCDAVFERAVAAGCTVRMPLADMFWGDRYGVLTDPFGHAWSIATTIRQVSDKEMEAGAAACSMQMKQMAERQKSGGR